MAVIDSGLRCDIIFLFIVSRALDTQGLSTPEWDPLLFLLNWVRLGFGLQNALPDQHKGAFKLSLQRFGFLRIRQIFRLLNSTSVWELNKLHLYLIIPHCR